MAIIQKKLWRSSMIEQSETINKEHPYNLQKALELFERGYLINILQLSNGCKTMASGMLGIQIAFLEQKMKKFNIVNRVENNPF